MCSSDLTQDKAISDWIWTNLSGRFWYDDYYQKDSANNVTIQKCAAFEIAGEASMFALILDQINQHENLWQSKKIFSVVSRC